MKAISILIPTFNDACTALVCALQQQASKLNIDYEIIVADDGSTDAAIVETNRSINQLPCCRVVERKQNAGRAAIRNFLAQQAQYDWLLFIDSDMNICRNDFLHRYATSEGTSVVYGGIEVGKRQKGNLRSLYESDAKAAHTTEKRQQAPYQDFHTANFLIRRDIFIAHPFDLRFRHYGYEDVLLGKALEAHNIPILHIDNPVCFDVFETNAHFVSKTEEGLRTLYQFRSELQGYSRLLEACNRLPRRSFLLWHRLFGHLERRNLTGRHPSLFLFKLYKLGYLMTLSAPSNVTARQSS